VQADGLGQREGELLGQGVADISRHITQGGERMQLYASTVLNITKRSLSASFYN
jgi:hypothetical protein